jgi:hypothetical protein
MFYVFLGNLIVQEVLVSEKMNSQSSEYMASGKSIYNETH